MRKINELKLKIKEVAVEIKTAKAELSKAQKNRCSVNTTSKMMWTLHGKKDECRHLHIAYCELRGRTRDQIEKPKKGHEACESRIEKIKAQYAWEIELQEAQ